MQVDVQSAPGPSGHDAPADLTQVKRYLRALQRRWPVVVGCLFAGLLLGWLTTPGAASTSLSAVSNESYYRATHTLIVDGTTPYGSSGGSESGSGSGTGAPNLEQAAFLVSTGDVPVQVADRLGIPVDQVTASVSGDALGSVSSLAITAVSQDPNQAVALADTASDELMKSLSDSVTQRYNAQRDEILKRLDDLKAQRTDLENQIKANPGQEALLSAQLDSVVNQYRLTYEQFQQLATQPLPSSGLRTIEAASPISIDKATYNSLRASNIAGPELAAVTTTTAAPTKSSSTSTSAPKEASGVTRAGLGGFLGLLAGLGLVFLLDKYDTRLRRREEVEASTGLAVITEIPPLSRGQQHETETLAFTTPRSRTAEAYRVVRTALLFANSTRPDSSGTEPGAEKRGQVIMVTSPSPGEGKTTTAANLAAVLAEGGMTVLVVNCDFRRPRIQKYLAEKSDKTPDLETIEVIAASGPLQAVATKVPQVRLVTGMGESEADEHANPLEIVAIQRRIVQFARKHFDVVLLDTAPFLTTNDASELLPETDTVLLVVRSGKTKREAAKRSAELLRRLDTNVLGVVFTGSNDSPSAEYYYQYYLAEETKKRRMTRGGDAVPAAVGANGNGSGKRARGAAAPTGGNDAGEAAAGQAGPIDWTH